MKKRIFALICALALLLAGAAQAEEGVLAAYREALENLYTNHTFPDGYTDEPDDVEGNGFAVYDVDGDGREELLVQWDNTVVASWYGAIYEYDEESQSFRTEYMGGPSFEFYNNGVIMVYASHNQSPSEVWPYALYRYDPDADEYVNLGSASAWERELSEEGFPADADLDGNGIVYQCGEDAGSEAWVDDGEYQEWCDSILGDARRMRVPFMDLTLENIERVG